MQLNSEIITTPPLASATVVLLRDAPLKGLQVFLLRRHTASAVLGGAYVFPGGKLDEADCAPGLHAHLDTSPQSLRTALGEPNLHLHTAAGLYIAAVREVLEECGVLYARLHDRQVLTHDAHQRQHWQKALHSGQAFADVLHSADLRVDTQHLAPWSRWITPMQASVTHKRFDTRFFMAVLPEGQHPIHDNIEAIDSVWLSPREALDRYWAGSLPLAPPQIMTLVSLLSHTCTTDVLNCARPQTPPLILPEPFDDEEGVRTLCYPGDPRHSVSHRAMPGPTRLRFVAGRFEPVGGFEDFL
ncbi:NUDIX domain-containing protein [Limnohabitans sp.]|uniref:NUDIX hydrolase n=1 Tax=Limnohabitans sp. TaxID=1907725 RepID=UPI00286F4F60|nr:NUDIX domain-containing protein [Limnohabitans sp.]